MKKLERAKARTGRRIVETQPQLIVEVSFEDLTRLVGVDGMNIGTYTSVPKPDGSLNGQGRGVWATLEGDMATWIAIGTGRFGAGGSVRYTGSMNFSTSSAKLAALNGISYLFEFDVAADGATHSVFYEWK